MKTAISIPDDIFKEIEKIAEENNCSRSEVFLIAVREFLEKLRSKRLLDDLNDAYSDIESPEEKSLREKSKKYYAEKVMRDDIGNKTR